MMDDNGTRVDDATMKTTGGGGAHSLSDLEAHSVAELPGEPAPYVKEPLFSKRVMLGWALGTLVVWFALAVVLPQVVRSVASEVRSNVTRNADGTMTIETPRGRITIRRDGDEVRVDRMERGRMAPTPPAGAPAAGAVPADAAQPAAPLPVPEATGKK
jgi:hypothetical protein